MTHCCLVSFQIHEMPAANLSRFRGNQDEAGGAVGATIRYDAGRIFV